MLASLLPGFRQLRAPLAAGALVLASAYMLIAGTDFAGAFESDEIGAGLAALVDAVDVRGRWVVAAVAAYLLGSTYMLLNALLLRRVSLRMLDRVCRAAYVSGDDGQSLLEWALSPFSRPSLMRLGAVVPSHPGDGEAAGSYDGGLAATLANGVVVSGGKRLLVSAKELHQEYDRLRSEAEFRDGVALPSLIAGMIVLGEVDLGAGTEVLVATIVVGFAVAMFLQARRLDREAYSMYAHAVADGAVSTAELDRIRAAVESRRGSHQDGDGTGTAR